MFFFGEEKNTRLVKQSSSKICLPIKLTSMSRLSERKTGWPEDKSEILRGLDLERTVLPFYSG